MHSSRSLWVVGGGGAMGLSNIDGMSAVENQTSTFRDYKTGQWYQIRLRVTEKKIETWIDDEQVIDLYTEGHKFSIWWQQEPARPFGIATWCTSSALRNLTLTRFE